MKRIFDVLGSFLGLVLISPIILSIAFVIYWKLGTPVYFIQPRPGKYGKVFSFLKFRTMSNDTDDDGNLLDDSQRLTNIGLFLRRTSLDELPSLWNVLKGDMSLVGPRPLLVQYLEYYTQEQKKRHNVKPGITGWAQVRGRNSLSWEEKFKYDLWYIQNQSLLLDLKILWLTIFTVAKRDGISADNSVTMPLFKGGEKN